VESHLYIALDLRYMAQPEFKRLYSEAERVRRQIGGFIQYLRNCPHRPQPETRNQKPETSRHTSRQGQPQH
jgi:hypothetical protein